MRWEDLFADLEGQLAAEEAVVLSAEVADRTRREQARIRLSDRLRAAGDTPLVVDVQGAGQLTGRVAGLGPDWLLLDDGSREALVPMAAVRSVFGPGRYAADPGAQGAVAARLGLDHALRVLARDRAHVPLVLRDGGVLGGTMARFSPTTWTWPSTRPTSRAGPGRCAGCGRCRWRWSRWSAAERRPGRRLPASSRSGSASPRPSGWADELAGLRVHPLDVRLECSVSTRHCPRPPTLMAGSSPLRTSA